MAPDQGNPLALEERELKSNTRVQRHGVASTHMRCMITARPRLTATLGAGLAAAARDLEPQRSSQLQRLTRVNWTLDVSLIEASKPA